MNLSKNIVSTAWRWQIAMAAGIALLLSVAISFVLPTATSAYSEDAFVIKVDTTKAAPDSKQFIVPTVGEGYNYTIDCDNSGPIAPVTNVTGNYTCEYSAPGEYTIVITGEFPQFSTLSLEDELEAMLNAKSLVSVEQWGSQQWRSMEYAFAFAQNMNIANGAGVPDLSQVESMLAMFTYAYAFNSPINDWDVSNVTNMSGMFQVAASFDQPLDSWDVSNVTDMVYMFSMASSFDRPLGAWSLNSDVDTMGMFEDTTYSTASYDATLRAWAESGDAQPSVEFGAHDLRYCGAADARAALVDELGWTIAGDSEDCSVPPIPVITDHGFDWEGDRLILTITGENLLLGMDVQSETGSYAATIAIMYGAQVYVNGQKYDWCIPEGLPREEAMYFPVTTTSPCFYYMDEESWQTLVSNTQFKIWLPDDFDTAAPGSVSIWKTPEYKFNQPVAPPAVVQSLAQVNTTTSVATPLRTATLGVTNTSEHNGCANIDAMRTELLAPDTVTAPSDTTILGGVGFELDCESPGGSAQVSLRLGAKYPDTSILSAYKDLSGDGALVPADVTFANRDGATYVEFPLTDGLTAADTDTNLVDEDGVADGRIVDPLYIGVRTNAVDVEHGDGDGSGAVAPISPTTPSVLVPGAPNSGFAVIAGGVVSRTAEAVWILVGIVLSGAVLVVGVIVARRVRSL